MTVKDNFIEARTYRYNFPTVMLGLITGVFSLVFKGVNALYGRVR